MYSGYCKGNWMRFPRIDHIRTSEFPAALADREWWRAGCGRHGESGREVGRGRDQRHRRQRCPNPCHHRIRDQDRVLLPRRHRRRARRQPLVHRVAGQQDRPHQSVMADAASSSTGKRQKNPAWRFARTHCGSPRCGAEGFSDAQRPLRFDYARTRGSPTTTSISLNRGSFAFRIR